jgi:hypothetical protein
MQYIDTLLQKLYPVGPQPLIANFFAGTLSIDEATLAQMQIAGDAKKYRDEHERVIYRKRDIENTIGLLEKKIAEADKTITSGDYSLLPLNDFIHNAQIKVVCGALLKELQEQITKLQASPDFESSTANAWTELERLATVRFQGMSRTAEEKPVEGKTIAEMLAIVFPEGKTVAGYDPRLDDGWNPPVHPRELSKPIPWLRQIEWLAERFDRGEIGGETFARIIAIKSNSIPGQALNAACAKLIRIGEEKQPSLRTMRHPPGQQNYPLGTERYY